MSADLFAEFSFNDHSRSPPVPPPATRPQLPPPSASKDPFDFFNTVSHAGPVTNQPVQASQPWPVFQSQPASTSPWGTASVPSALASSSKPPASIDEEDDGWGDFEVAEPTAPSQAPIHAAVVTASPNISSPISWHSPVHSGAPTLSISPSIAWQSPAQNAPPASSVSPSISWQTPAQVATPAPSISPSMSWQRSIPTETQVPAPQSTAAQAPPPRTRVVRASTLDLMSNNLVDTSGLSRDTGGTSRAQRPARQFSQQVPYDTQPSSRMKPKLKEGPTDPNVLFDAEDFELQIPEGDEGDDDEDDEDDDEFGDFETVASALPAKPAPPKPPPVVASPPPPSMDLLSLDDPISPPPQPTKAKTPPSQLLGTLAFGSTAANYPQAPKSPSYQDRNPFPALAIKTPTGPAPKDDERQSATPITAWPTLDSAVAAKPEAYKDDDEGWGAWDDFPANDSKKTNADTAPPSESWNWDAVDNVQPTKHKISDDAPPPTNVPPPSVILSVFPDLLNTSDALFKPMSGQNASIKQRILSDPKAVEFLEAYVLLATTAARVIAGRKQRWHRDKILAKSMSISAAGSKGMKLAGVDKTQSVREDREAADVAAVWRSQVGRLRSAVAAAKAAGKASTLRVPEISDTIPVHTAKSVPTAPKACIICGLKREERVARVDIEVEDSFGEWWADHWGHKACKNFWIEHEQMLRQR